MEVRGSSRRMREDFVACARIVRSSMISDLNREVLRRRESVALIRVKMRSTVVRLDFSLPVHGI